MKNFTRLTLTLALLFGVLGGANSVKANRYIVYNNGTAGTNDYSKQAICKLNNPLVLGTQYIIKAKIKAENADGSTGLALWIQDEADYPNTKTSYQASIVPTKEFVEYTWYFTPSEFQGTRLVFCTGLLGGRIYIDDVTCKPNGESTEFVDNGSFYSSDISNWTNNYQGPSYTRFDYEVSVPVGAAGFATFSAAKAVNVDGVVTAYGAKYQGGAVVLTPVTQIPAGAGVIIEAAEGTYTVPAINSAAALGSDNELLVSDGSVVTADKEYYALYNGSHGVGFYLIDNGVTIPAGKAYLQIVASGRSFLGFSDEATAISNVKAETADDAIYNVAGQRVTKTQKGLYIVNGKKVLVK